MRNARVAARITELQIEAGKRAEIEIDDVLDMLLESYRDAKRDGQHGPSVRAAELIGKSLRMFTDRISFEEQGVSDDDLIDALAAGDVQKREMLLAVLGAEDGFVH